MRSGWKTRLAAIALALVANLASVSAMAATANYYHRGTFMVGGGVNSAVGEANPYLNSSGTFFLAAAATSTRDSESRSSTRTTGSRSIRR
jgi:hypothetical protein